MSTRAAEHRATGGSRIALGTAQFGLRYGIANEAGQVDADQAQAMLDFARSAGIDTLDTAVVYGSAETLLGAIGVSDFRVITKVPALTTAVTHAGEWMLEQVTASLARLKVDHLHALMLHHADDLSGPRGAEVCDALVAIKRLGLVRKIGVSIYRPEQLEAVVSRLPIDMIQAPLNVFDNRLARSGWLDRLAGLGTEIHVRSVFLQGLLLMPLTRLPPRFAPWRPLLQGWHDWLAATHRMPTAVCIGHALYRPAIGRAVVGCDSLAQLRQVVEVAARPLEAAPVAFESDDERLINPALWGPT
jgi:aryl-alcohol dehydrogenase-like predicted oxidoreductase